MAYNARKIISEHGAHRAALSPPRSARRVLSLSHTPGNEKVAEEDQGKRRLSARRTLSQPLVLSSDSSDEEQVRPSAPSGRRSGPVPSQSSQPVKRGTGSQTRKTIDRDKYRKVLQDEDEEAGGGDKPHAALPEKRVAKQRGTESAPPAGPEKTSPDFRLKERRDVLRSRGTSIPVARACSALCYDVGGFLTFGPTALTSTTNLREFRGKVVLIGQKDLLHAGRFSSAGAAALIVAAKNPEDARVEYNCSKETRIPVVFLSEVGALALEHGSLVKMMFDVASESPMSDKQKLSKNTTYRRAVSGSQEKPSSDSKVESQLSNAFTEGSADSGTDSDKDAEFYLVRRRRKSATNSNRSQTPRVAAAPARREQGSSTHPVVKQIASDAAVMFTTNSDKDGSDSQAVAKNLLQSGVRSRTQGKGETLRNMATSSIVDEMMEGTSSEILRKIEVFAYPNKKGVSAEQFVAALAERLNEKLACSSEPRMRLDAMFRVRELCRAKPNSVAPQVVNAVIQLHGALDAIWDILAGPTSVQDEDSAACWLSAQMAAAVCLRHVALDQMKVELMLQSSRAITVLGGVMSDGPNEDVRQKVAALIANLSVEHQQARAMLCSNESLVRGLCRLLFTSNYKALDSSLAALSNLSLDTSLTGSILRHLNMERLVMILLSGSSKSRHRGAGLIRNLLYSPETRHPVAQVPGLAKALTKLQNTGDSETKQRAWLALSMLQQEKSGEDVSMLEKKFMDTGDKKAGLAHQPQMQSTHKLSSTRPEDASVEKQFQSLEVSKIDFFSPAIQHVSPKLNDDASLIIPTVDPAAYQRTAGFPAQSTPPKAVSSSDTPQPLWGCDYHCGFSSTFEQVAEHEKTCVLSPRQQPGPSSARSQAPDSWKIKEVVDSAADRAIECILTSPDPVQVVDAVQALRSSLQSSTGRSCRDQIGSEVRLFPAFGRLLMMKHKVLIMHQEVLGLLRDLCSNHAANTERLCRHEAVLRAILGFSIKTADREAGIEAMIAAELVSFCMLDDANFEKLALARSSWKRGLHNSHERGHEVGRRQRSRSPQPLGARSVVRHSANFSARQAIISREWAA